MVHSVDSFLVSSFRDERVPEMVDTFVLKEYIAGKNEDKEAAFICDIVEQMTELRFEAETEFRKNKRGAKNRRGELRLSVDEMAEKLTSPIKSEPPEQLISIIAKRDYGVLETLMLSMRKVLQRERSMVQVSNVQQIDSHCLRWLARQPGYTAAEKGGERQRLLAVVRNETKNTLENRVLKDFIYRASVMARRYIALYEKLYPSSERIKNVKKLYRLLQNAWKSPDIQEISAIKGNVRPNYVLLHDAKYNKMWVLYRQILTHVRIAEIVWPYRYALFGEYFCCWLSMRLCLEAGRLVFDSSYWVSIAPRRGRFFVNPLFSNIYQNSTGLLDWRVSKDCGELIVRNRGGNKTDIKLVYIPSCIRGGVQIPLDNTLYVVYSFSPEVKNSVSAQSNVLLLDSEKDIDEISTEFLQKIGI